MLRVGCLLVFVGAALGLGAQPQGPSPWIEDWTAAQRAARSTGKPLLVDVTGSDWAAPAQLMESEIYALPGFAALAQRYVLVRIDFPKHSPQSEALRVQNRRWVERYPVDSVPTVYVIDAQGLVLGRRVGLVDGGLQAFEALVDGFASRAPELRALVAATTQAAPGVDRARAYDALFRQAEAWDLGQWADLPLKITQEDRDGKAGLRPRYLVHNAYQRLLATWADRDDYHQVVADLQDLARKSEPWPDLRQKVLFTQGLVLLNALDDERGARDAFRASRAVDPKSDVAERAAQFLDRLP